MLSRPGECAGRLAPVHFDRAGFNLGAGSAVARMPNFRGEGVAVRAPPRLISILETFANRLFQRIFSRPSAEV